mmetsp:Transcript_104836/g.128025  ORF Transcript_104836/g.128025 Transcript_104836/m.128025 type:complete len:469 (-) Transcript_104836:71-1477(-)
MSFNKKTKIFDEMDTFFSSTISSLARDAKGFLNEVVDELRFKDNNDDMNLESNIDIINNDIKEINDNDDELIKLKEREMSPELKDNEITKSDPYKELYAKYIKLKTDHQKSRLMVEKLSIHNKALKDTLNEQINKNQKQSEALLQQKSVNDELIRRLSSMDGSSNDKSGEQIQSVSVDDNEINNDDEIKKLKINYAKVKNFAKKKNEAYKKLENEYALMKGNLNKEIDLLKKDNQILRQNGATVVDNDGNDGIIGKILKELNGNTCDNDKIKRLHNELCKLLESGINGVEFLVQNSVDIRERRDSSSIVMVNSEEKSNDNNSSNDGLSYNCLEYINAKMDEVQLKHYQFMGLSVQWKNIILKLRNNNNGAWLKWNQNDIITWIMELNDGYFKKYNETLTANFKKNDVNGPSLANIDKSDLFRFGIQNFEDQTKLLKCIQTLIEPGKDIPSNNPTDNVDVGDSETEIID